MRTIAERAARLRFEKENAMRKSWKAWVAAVALLTAMPLLAQQTAKEAEKEAGSFEQYDKLLRQSGNHEILARLAGNWQADLKAMVWGGTPFRETSMKDTVNGEMIMGGNFLQVHSSSEIAGGVPSKTMAIMGYNGADRQFYRLYMSEGEPRGTWSTGVYIKSKDSLVFRGTEHDPVSGDKFEKWDVFTFGADKDKFHYELSYMFADGSEMKVANGDYTRVKDEKKP
jgi:Protein of unknown function (DUF1579)